MFFSSFDYAVFKNHRDAKMFLKHVFQWFGKNMYPGLTLESNHFFVYYGASNSYLVRFFYRKYSNCLTDCHRTIFTLFLRVKLLVSSS